jgi:hypothetical protein
MESKRLSRSSHFLTRPPARNLVGRHGAAPVQHHYRKIWSPAAVTLRAHPGCSRLRSLARSRDGCQRQTKLAPSTFVACRKCLPLRSPPLGGFDTEAHSVR